MSDSDDVEVTLTQDHLDKSGHYTSFDSCILATALKERFPNQQIGVYDCYCEVGDDTYRFEEDTDAVQAAYPHYGGERIQEARKPFPFTITLRKST
jgi:hypothetical protein